MEYNSVTLNKILGRYKNFVTISNKNELIILSRFDLAVLKVYDLQNFKYAIHLYSDKIVLTDIKQKHFEIDPSNLTIIEYNDSCYNISVFEEVTILYCPKNKEYVVEIEHNKINSISRNFNHESYIYKDKIIECCLFDADNSFVHTVFGRHGFENWNIKIKDKIVRSELIQQYLVLECMSSTKGTIVLDLDSGKEYWSYKDKYSKIDYENAFILFGGDDISIFDLNKNTFIATIAVSPTNNFGYYPHFVDDEGVYYTKYDESFGKICKISGNIIWEFDLEDFKGEKRKLSDWHLLGNGNLFLQAMPNHPNGDLTCLFNPNENLEFSKVKNGIRIL